MFGSKASKEDKQAQEIAKFVERYQLDEMDEKDLSVVKRIASDLVASGTMKLGMALNIGTKAEDHLKIGYLSAIFEQNWILIRLLSRLNRNLEAK